MSASGVVIYGAQGQALSTPQSRRLSSMQRQRASLQAKFDAVQNTTENARYWANADYLGPNAELQAGVRRELRSRARYECANNSYAAGIVRTLANDTIGTGPELQITDPLLSKDEAAFVEREIWDWFTAVGLPRKLRHMRLAKARDGETFAMFFTNPGLAFDGPVQLDIRPFEADFVASTNYANSLSDLLDGIITDDFGNVVAYNVLREHPGDAVTMIGEADLIPASLIIHLFHSDRPGAYRGCPELLSSLPLYAQLRRYTLAVLRAAESAAIPSWMIETQQPPSEMEFGDAFDTLETERGMGVTLPAGYKMSQLKAEHPTTTYPAFKREIVSETGRGAGVPYNINAGDSSSYNYSSGRLDHRTYFKALRIERSYWEQAALRPILRAWWSEARKANNYLPQAARERLPVHNWRWDGDEHVDPTKEADAAVTRVAHGLTALTDEVASLGGDIEVIHRKNAEALGLSLDEYRKRMADKFFGAQIASSSQETPEEPASNPFGGSQNA